MEEKANTILAEREEETFEFAPVQQIDNDRYVSNVQNHSHDDGEAHIYPVFFDVARDDTILGAHVAECGCPSDEYHSDPCKHREAAAQCGELLGAILEMALNGDEDSKDAHATADAADGGREAAATDGGECELCNKLPGGAQCWSCVRDGQDEVDD